MDMPETLWLVPAYGGGWDILTRLIHGGSRILALGWCVWAPLWSEICSNSYNLSEEQGQARQNKPGP